MIRRLADLLAASDPGLVRLRLEETAIGTASGASVAIVVLPARTSETMREQATSFLVALAAYLRNVSERLASDHADADLVGDVRVLDQRFQELCDTARHVVSRPYRLLPSVSRARPLRALAPSTYHARNLARHPDADGEAQDVRQRLAAVAACVAANVDAVGAALDGGGGRAATETPDELFELDGELDERSRLRPALVSLRRVDESVAAFGRDEEA